MISEAFEDIFKIITTVLKPICDAVTNFYTNVLEPIINGIKKVTSVFGEIGNVIHHIEDVFAPIKWALHAANCILKKVVQPVINDIMDVSYHTRYCMVII